MRTGALPIKCAVADELSLLLAFAWIVGGPVRSDVPEPTVSGLTAPPEPFPLPTAKGRAVAPRGISEWYHDQLSTVSMIECFRDKRVRRLVGWVQSRTIIEGVGLDRIVCKSNQGRKR